MVSLQDNLFVEHLGQLFLVLLFADVYFSFTASVAIRNTFKTALNIIAVTAGILLRKHCSYDSSIMTYADLSKAFDCIPHDLIIAKLSAYNFSDEALSYIYSYLTNRRQCVRINNTHSQLETIISGVPQGSILGPILFNLSINDLFFFVVLASLYNFADDNTLSAFATTVSELIKILESESEVVIDWFKINKMVVVNPDKFQAIILDKRKRDHTDEHITVDNQQIKLCHL